MKTILFLTVTLFHQFPNGEWIFGALFENPRHSIVIDSEGECVKYNGEVQDCSSQEWSTMLGLVGNDFNS